MVDQSRLITGMSGGQKMDRQLRYLSIMVRDVLARKK